MSSRSLPQLLAPAGDWDAARAAVENGADAVYFGLKSLNARLRAKNFGTDELPSLLELLHRRGVAGYLVCNTLVFPDEMEQAERMLRQVISAGVDALIVQDLGLCRLIRRLSPDVPLHASTQMTITDASGARVAARLGCRWVTVARECSLAQIASIARELGTQGPELEVFVHGALCVSYSGQCSASQAFGGRSANRGSCAQPCRLPYRLVENGRAVELGDKRHLISPADLCALAALPELCDIGVAALKIEGRLKSAEYVAAVTRAYRHALDEAAAGAARAPRADYALQMTFSRGHCEGWLRGDRHEQLINAEFAESRGLRVGRVTAVAGGRLAVALDAPLAPGDGVLVDGGEGREWGARVYSIEERGGQHWLGFERGLDLGRVRAGDAVWKTSDPGLERTLRRSFAATGPPRCRRPIDLEVSGRPGEPLVVEARDEQGRAVRLASELPLAAAERQPLDEERLRLQLGRLGGTAFELRDLRLHLESASMLPLRELNRLRRALVGELEARRAAPPRWQLSAPEVLPPVGHDLHVDLDPGEPRLAVLVRDPVQLEPALEAGAGLIYLDLVERDALAHALAVTRRAGVPALLATPRITKPGEERRLGSLRSLDPDGFLIRNAGQRETLAGLPCVGDASLHATNARAAECLIHELGLTRATASFELDALAVERLLRTVPSGWLEVVAHLHPPLFHTELCLARAHLGARCGAPAACRARSLRLLDRKGAEHPVLLDSCCRSTVFHARARDLGAELPRWVVAGARVFRCELLLESPAQTFRLVSRLRRQLSRATAS